MTAIIDYDTGNLRSVAEALRRAGAEFTVTADPATLLRAERVILPGVGEASSAMARLREKGLDTLVPALTCPVLGICIGMQLLCRSSEEGVHQISEEYEEETDKQIANFISVLEPTLVIILSIFIGLILISFLLPLIGIMSSIG